MDPDRFAEKALRAVARNRAIIIIPGWWRMIWWVNRLSPSLGLWLAAWDRRKYLETAKRAVAHQPPNRYMASEVKARTLRAEDFSLRSRRYNRHA